MKGRKQGDMSPVVEDYALQESAYSQTQPGKTTEYIERNNKRQSKMASDVKKQAYMGRYS